MILEGKTLATQIKESLKDRAQAVSECLGRPIKLSAISSTEDYTAHLYLKKEVSAAEKIGIATEVHEINNSTTVSEFLSLVKKLSDTDSVEAILIPRPLPLHLAESNYAALLDYRKDIDGMSAINMGNLFACKTWQDVLNLPGFVPCTAMAVMRLLEFYNIDLQGLEAAVIGRSVTVGRPLSHLLTCKNATVKTCHRKTNLERALKEEDIICSAAGQPRLLNADWIKKDAYVIDISTNWNEKLNQLCGDAISEDLDRKGISYSPVPGGVGPITLAILLENIVLSGERKIRR